MCWLKRRNQNDRIEEPIDNEIEKTMDNSYIMYLERFYKSGNATIGELTAENCHICYTLEDRMANNVYDTAIPNGEYEVEVTWSPKFQRMLPLLKNVPNREGIRIHRGNSAKDCVGCILVGEKVDIEEEWLYNSRVMEETLTAMLTDIQNEKRKILIRIY